MAENETEKGAAGAPQATEDPAVQASPALRILRERHAAGIIAVHAYRGDATAIVDRAALLDVCRTLRDDPELAFDFLMDVTAVDYIGRVPRFEVVYHFYSLAKNHRVRIKVPLEESDPSVPSLVPLWEGANWLERETWDMYGIRFEGHPDLRRIYLYEEFQGYPLRKDYPKEKRQPLIGPGAIGRTPETEDLGI